MNFEDCSKWGGDVGYRNPGEKRSMCQMDLDCLLFQVSVLNAFKTGSDRQSYETFIDKMVAVLSLCEAQERRSGQHE